VLAIKFYMIYFQPISWFNCHIIKNPQICQSMFNHRGGADRQQRVLSLTCFIVAAFLVKVFYKAYSKLDEHQNMQSSVLPTIHTKADFSIRHSKCIEYLIRIMCKLRMECMHAYKLYWLPVIWWQFRFKNLPRKVLCQDRQIPVLDRILSCTHFYNNSSLFIHFLAIICWIIYNTYMPIRLMTTSLKQGKKTLPPPLLVNHNIHNDPCK
jgi:hypothetical protein